MRKLCVACLTLSFLAIVQLSSVRVSGAAGSLPPLLNLAPGTDLRLQQIVDVNIVLIGFRGLVDPAAMVAVQELPLFNGVPKANGQGQTFLGQRFDFSYHIVPAPTWFDDLVFAYLRSAAQPQAPVQIFQGLPPMPITPYQALYNYCNLDPAFDPTHGCSFDPSAPRVNKRFITQNYLLDAAFVEKVLSQNVSSLLGVDVTRPTVVLLNWWGRPDYVDHIYLDGSEPDPETHFPRGFIFGNELAGYGATNDKDPETCQGDCIFHRVWFYDVSAGPMGRTGGFDLVSGVPRFIAGANFNSPFPNIRFHHTADYGTIAGAYRPLDSLVEDVTALAGFVFISQLAYAAPINPPALTPPNLPKRLVLDINRWSWSGQSFASQLNVPLLTAKMSALPYDIGVEVTEQPDGSNSNLGRVWRCSMTSRTFFDAGQSCYGNRDGGYALADIATYFSSHLLQYLTGAPDYEVPIFQFNVPPELDQPLWEAISFNNYFGLNATATSVPDLRQTFVFTSSKPSDNARFGHGNLLEHEVGHHLGFAHSFGGYQCVTDSCGPGEFYPWSGNPFTWFSMSGNYASGMMTYVLVNNDYSRFELDNLQRWLTWEYLDMSNFIVAQIGLSPRSVSVETDLTQADALAGAATTAYRAYDHESAEKNARAAYNKLLAAANKINVHLSPSAYQATRRNPHDFNKALRDFLASRIGDSSAEMTGAISSIGVRGLETQPLLSSPVQLTQSLPRPTRISLR